MEASGRHARNGRAPVSDQCVKHSFDMAEGQCGSCGYLFCGRCLVYAHGPKKPPLCLSCAMAAGGVRSTAANTPIASKSELRKAQKERRRAERRAAKAAKEKRRSTPEPPEEGDGRPGVIPAPTRPVPSRSPAAGWNRVR